MIDTLLSVLLAASTLVLGIVAIGGETWNKERDSLLDRVTHRGWIAILFIALSFILTVVKDIRSNTYQSELSQVQEELIGKQEQSIKISAILTEKHEELGKRTVEVSELQREIVDLNKKLNIQISRANAALKLQPRIVDSASVSIDKIVNFTGIDVYNGDTVNYSKLNIISKQKFPDSPLPSKRSLFETNDRVVLLVGDNRYPLKDQNGSIEIYVPHNGGEELKLVKVSGLPGLTVNVSVSSVKDIDNSESN